MKNIIVRLNLILVMLVIVCFATREAVAGVNLRIQDRRVKESSVLLAEPTVRIENEQMIVIDAENNPMDPEVQYAVELKKAKERAIAMQEIIMHDLQNTNLFAIVNLDTKMQRKLRKQPILIQLDINSVPQYSLYADEGIEAVLTMEVALQSDGTMKCSARLWDIMDENTSFGKYYRNVNDGNWRRIAHIIADNIYSSITGENSGIFDSKIAFVVESGPIRKRIKKLAEMDFDGENFKPLTNGEKLVLTPTYSNNTKDVYYLEYSSHVAPPVIKQFHLDNGSITQLGSFSGMAYSPARNPVQNNLLAIAISEGSISNLYEVDLSRMSVRKLTDHRSINTTPNYSPDGKKIVFSSDRNGPQKLYILDLANGSAKQISHGEGNYAKPAWSPDGRLIAFTKQQRGRFSIGLMTVDGRNEREIANGYMVEGVKWSPNGRYVIYSKQTKAFGKESIPKLFINDILTGYEYQVPIPEGVAASDPDWVMKAK